jgi:hypothetical protein
MPDRTTRRGVELIVSSITPEGLASLGDGWILWEGAWPKELAPLVIDLATDSTIGLALNALSPRGEEAAIHREQLQAILDVLGLKPTEKFARLTDIAAVAVAEGQDAKATAAKAA